MKFILSYLSHFSPWSHVFAWWRHHDMETLSTLRTLCRGNPSLIDGFLYQEPVMWSFDFLLLFASICCWISSRVSGDLRRRDAHETSLWWVLMLINIQTVTHTAYLSSYPGYFREPHWLSMGLPEISRVTWQVLCTYIVYDTDAFSHEG